MWSILLVIDLFYKILYNTTKGVWYNFTKIIFLCKSNSVNSIYGWTNTSSIPRESLYLIQFDFSIKK